MTKEEAISEIRHDVLESNPYDVIQSVGGKYQSEIVDVFYADEGAEFEEKETYEEYLKEFAEFLTLYKNLYKYDRISVSDIIVVEASKNCCDGMILLVDGQNGLTQVSRQSLKHVTDIISYLEDHFGARAFISSTTNHSDVYYYTIKFVIWDETVENLKNKNYGNLKPLFFDKEH